MNKMEIIVQNTAAHLLDAFVFCDFNQKDIAIKMNFTLEKELSFDKPIDMSVHKVLVSRLPEGEIPVVGIHTMDMRGNTSLIPVPLEPVNGMFECNMDGSISIANKGCVLSITAQPNSEYEIELFFSKEEEVQTF